MSNYATNLLLKTHTEHLISFIDHEVCDSPKVCCLFCDHLHEPPRSSNQDFNTRLQHLPLLVLVLSSQQRSNSEIRRKRLCHQVSFTQKMEKNLSHFFNKKNLRNIVDFRIALGLCVDLLTELSCRCHDESDWSFIFLQFSLCRRRSIACLVLSPILFSLLSFLLNLGRESVMATCMRLSFLSLSSQHPQYLSHLARKVTPRYDFRKNKYQLRTFLILF